VAASAAWLRFKRPCSSAPGQGWRLKGGPARAGALTDEQKREIAQRAAAARWRSMERIAEGSTFYLETGWLAAPSRGPVRRSQWDGLTAKATIQPPTAMHTGKIT